MESISIDADSDDREEGEIVDDDFEDISDNSIIGPFISGKSVSANEHLPAISLSSVTEVDEPKSDHKNRQRHKISRKKGTKTKKRRNSHRKSTCSDSDSDDYRELDRKLQKQLKAAIRVDETEERHKNSLRSRLKGMTKLDESDGCVEKNDVIVQKVSSDDGDSELAELRLEALRTAVLNKFKHRKKRKLKENNDNGVLSDISVKTDNLEMNKENHTATENCPKKLCVENPVQAVETKIEINNVKESTTPPEDDEDVLRALLLASMSKKITFENEARKPAGLLLNQGIKHKLLDVNNKKEIKQPVKTVPVKSVTTFRNHFTKNNIVNNNLKLPKVKPLVIKLNQDSDSDDDLFNKTKTNNNQIEVIQTNTEIESSVEKFLKEQRAKVEAQLSPIPKCPVKPKSPPAILEKSSVKLLPKVKQLEYQKLLLRLKNAEKRPRIRRLSIKFSGEGKPIASTPKKIIKPKIPVGKQVVVTKVNPKATNLVSQVDSAASIKSEVRTLHKILKEIQVQKNGRLQIQEKYKLLMPVIKKINEASTERRKWEEGMKRLLQEITEMKTKLTQSQQDFTTHVNDLLREKLKIDKSMVVKKIETAANVTGLPIPSNVKKTGTTAVVTTQVTSTTVIEKPSLVTLPTISPVVASVPKTTAPTQLPEEKPMEDDVIDAPLNPGDPNDIDIIYRKQKNVFPRYISPLDNVNRVVVDDPFSIVCPYDVDGNCRDPECVYKHLFK